MNTKRGSSGKVLIIFLIIFVILSLSIAGLAMFFLSKEKDRRISTETALQDSITNVAKLETKLQDAIKQGFLLQEKNKEADEKINGLLDELELQEGIREELKKENVALKDKLDRETEAKAELQEKLATTADLEQRIPELENQLETEQTTRQELEQKLQDAQDRMKILEDTLAKMQKQNGSASDAAIVETPAVDVAPDIAPDAAAPAEGQAEPESPQVIEAPQKEVQLEKIVVAPAKAAPEGRIIMVDGETEFVIVNLGANHGIKEEQVLSVSRGKDYLGDIKITRVQPEMSAADFIAPLTSRQVRKDDQVIIK